jgi:hypothetical protein
LRANIEHVPTISRFFGISIAGETLLDIEPLR